ncbi:hypothetical protein E3T26_02435 [Cryobacterium sp. TMT1-21]|uniref:hypothetical protein n=1 Tax=Cryobacterium sp. TMT1-21 TaxID=1259234 RepID=UPI00106A6161|nr:hypothetical protein [Cryobacterium sp. TMT1-21]TFD17280.1 hypothetical protein E3T26_02435 [Cryobacterium sp. TMT1-21]
MKTYAAIVLAVLAMFALPTAANAADYVVPKNVSCSGVFVPGEAVTLPGLDEGKHMLTGTWANSASVGAATRVAGVSDVGRASRGYNSPVLLIWIASGVLLLGAALALVLSIVRRERVTARKRTTQ